jgi:hypothetical protein
MKAGLVHGFRHDETEAAKNFGADGNALQRHAAVGIVPLASRQHRRHDHRTGMYRPALEGVVKILAMSRGAVDESGARRRQRARMSDRGARTVIVAACERASYVVFVARGDAETDDVDQEILAFARSRRRKRTLQRGDLRRQRFSDRSLRQSRRHQTRNSFV